MILAMALKLVIWLYSNLTLFTTAPYDLFLFLHKDNYNIYQTKASSPQSSFEEELNTLKVCCTGVNHANDHNCMMLNLCPKLAKCVRI